MKIVIDHCRESIWAWIHWFVIYNSWVKTVIFLFTLYRVNPYFAKSELLHCHATHRTQFCQPCHVFFCFRFLPMLRTFIRKPQHYLKTILTVGCDGTESYPRIIGGSPFALQNFF